MTASELLTRADRAFANHDNVGGLELLREYTASSPTDSASWHRRAVVEEQIGDWSQAGFSHYHCIQAAPGHPIAHLYAGSWLQRSDNIDAAVASYSLAQEADPLILELWKNPRETEQTRIKSKHANQISRQYLSTQHRQLFDQHSSLIKDAAWVQNHDLPLTHINDDFSPELFFIPGLTQKPFYQAQEFNWTKTLCTRTDAIQQELQAALTQHLEELSVNPYIPTGLRAPPTLHHLVGSPKWTAIDLCRNGKLNAAAADRFPNTLEAVQEVPFYGLDNDTPFELIFSVLQPHNSIGEHYGQSNHSLNVHLGLKTPAGGYLSVVNENRYWQEGELLIFDDSFKHSAHNTSDQQRIVLLFSVWHPDLTDEQRSDIQVAFNTRQAWLDSRHDKLQLLLPKSKN